MSSRIFSSSKIALFVIAALALTGCKEQIIHNLEEVDANRIVTALHSGGIEAEKKSQADGRWAIAVDDENSMSALQLLDDKRTIRAPIKASTIKGSMISSREAQKFEYERGLSQEIENTLRTLEGILEARVHLNLPTPDPLLGKDKDKQNGTGSVLVVARQNLVIDKLEIAKLVSGASGINSDRISVLISLMIPEEPSRLMATSHAIAKPNPDWLGLSTQLLSFLAPFLLVGYVFITRRKFRKLQNDFESVRS